MKAAGRDVCNGFEIGVDVDQRLEHGARYQDKRPVAKKMWATIMRVLADVRAIPKDQSYGQDPIRVQGVGRRIMVEDQRPRGSAGGSTSRSRLIGLNFRRGGSRCCTMLALVPAY